MVSSPSNRKPTCQLPLAVRLLKSGEREETLVTKFWSFALMDRGSVAVESSPSSATAPSTAVAATALAPGFRFHPTDDELVSYYLKRKVLGRPVRFDAIGDVDIYKYEPWDLAGSIGFLCFSLCLFVSLRPLYLLILI